MWIDRDNLRLDGEDFRATPADRSPRDDGSFLLVKGRPLIDRYERLAADLLPRRIVELGICRGGSTAFLALLMGPDRLVALDIEPTPVPELDEFIERRGLGDVVRPHYGVDQADTATLDRIVAAEFGDDRLDLVVDDASHRMGPTVASFDALFPRLSPGGVFVIEDWSGLHHYERVMTERLLADPGLVAGLTEALGDGAQPVTPLSVMLFQLVLAAAYAPDVVASIDIIDGWCAVTRGPASIAAGFTLRGLFSDSAAALIRTLS